MIIVINTFIFASCWICDYLTWLLNRKLVSRVKLCLVSVFPDIVKDSPKIRYLPKIFLKSFENVAPGSWAYYATRPGNGSGLYRTG